MVARRFYVARRLEIGLNFSMQNQLLLEPTWLFFFILPPLCSSRRDVCRCLAWMFCVVTLFFAGAHAAPAPRRPPRRDFALGVSALYGVCPGRLKWRNSAASSAFYGERGTGIAPRLPHPGEVSPGTPSLLSSASSQLRLAVCKRFEWMRYGVG